MPATLPKGNWWDQWKNQNPAGGGAALPASMNGMAQAPQGPVWGGAPMVSAAPQAAIPQALNQVTNNQGFGGNDMDRTPSFAPSQLNAPAPPATIPGAAGSATRILQAPSPGGVTDSKTIMQQRTVQTQEEERQRSEAWARSNKAMQEADTKRRAEYDASPIGQLVKSLGEVGDRDVQGGVRNAAGQLVQRDRKTGEERTYDVDAGTIGEWNPLNRAGLPDWLTNEQAIQGANNGITGYNPSAFGLDYAGLVKSFEKQNRNGKYTKVDPAQAAWESLAKRKTYANGLDPRSR